MLRRSSLRTAISITLSTATMAVAVWGGAPSVAGARRTDVSITLYNGQHPQTTQALVNAFEKATGIQVHVRSNDEAVLADQIVAEGPRSPADVIFTENSPALMYLEGRGLLAKVDASTLAHVPSKYDSPAGDWVGVTARVSVIVYNTRRLSAAQVPSSVLDLANRRWRGKLALAPSETDFQPIVTAIAKARGRAYALRWLEGVKANAQGHIYPDNETLVAKVNAGQAVLGIVNHYYWYRLRAELGSRNIHSALRYLAPGNVGYVLDVSGAGILASSRHKAAAQRFLAFLVSRKGQRIIARGDSFEYPLGSGVKTAKHLKPFASLKPYPLTIRELGDGTLPVHLLQQAGLL